MKHCIPVEEKVEVKTESHTSKEEKERLFKRLVESEDDDALSKKPRLLGPWSGVMGRDASGKKKARVGVWVAIHM